MRCKDCRFWHALNKDAGYCEEISSDTQLKALAVCPVYDGDPVDMGENGGVYDEWLKRTDLGRLQTGAHFGCVHFEPKKAKP